MNLKYKYLVLILLAALQGCGGGGGTGASSPEPNPPSSDTTPPVITLLGESDATHEQGTVYTDAGATASDDVDGDVDVTVSGSVDEAVAGTYSVTYSASDSSGNSVSATRTVTVRDTIPPVVTLTGDASVTIDKGVVYSDLGATATDSVDGDLDVVITGEVGSEVGTYTLTYSCLLYTSPSPLDGRESRFKGW